MSMNMQCLHLNLTTMSNVRLSVSQKPRFKLIGKLAIGNVAIEIMAHQKFIRQPVCFHFGEAFGSSRSLAF